MIKDISLLLNNTAQGVQSFQGRAGVIERLQQAVENRDNVSDIRRRFRDDDAVEVNITNQNIRQRILNSENPRVLYNRLKEIQSASGEERSALVEGQSFRGVYENGQFVTSTGFKGSYAALTAGGHIGFRLDGFKGILKPDGTAYAFNPQTDQIFQMQVKYGDGKYEVTDVKERKLEQFVPSERPIAYEGQDSFAVKYDQTGNISVKMRVPGGEVVEGKGFMDKKGHLVIGLSNGATFEGHYDFSPEGKLRIYE